MKYLCLAYEEEQVLNELSRAEWDSLREETLSYVEELRKRNILIAAEPLQSVRTASTVRVRNEKLVVTDGPFAETKETLGGIVLIDVRAPYLEKNNIGACLEPLKLLMVMKSREGAAVA